VGEFFRKSDAHSGQRTSTLPGESAKVDRLGSIGPVRGPLLLLKTQRWVIYKNFGHVCSRSMSFDDGQA